MKNPLLARGARWINWELRTNRARLAEDGQAVAPGFALLLAFVDGDVGDAVIAGELGLGAEEAVV